MMFADKLFPSKIDLELNWITQQSKLKRKKKRTFTRIRSSAIHRWYDDLFGKNDRIFSSNEICIIWIRESYISHFQLYCTPYIRLHVYTNNVHICVRVRSYVNMYTYTYYIPIYVCVHICIRSSRCVHV